MKKLLSLLTVLLFWGSFTVVKADYFVAGTMNEWSTNSNDWKMSGSGPYSVTKQLNSGTYQFKVTNGSWGWSTADFDSSLSNVTLSTKDGNISFTLSTTSDVTFYYNTSTSKAYVQAEAVVVPSYTFPAGTTIYYDFTAYSTTGINTYVGGNEAWYGSTDNVIAITLSSDWEVTASTKLWRSGASGWNDYYCTTLPTAGQDLIISTDGINYTWGTYSGSTPDPTPATIKMRGNFLGDWANTNAFTIADGNATASLTLNITSTGTKNFGMRIGSDDNWTSNGASITRASSSAAITSGSGNCSLNVDVAGEYTFTWTYATNTLSVTYPAPPAVVSEETIYFVNVAEWAAPRVHLWGGSASGTSWPGVEMILESEKVNGYDIYSYTAAEGAYANCIFSNNGQNQSADLVWSAGKYYYSGTWYNDIASIPAPPVLNDYTIYFKNTPGWSNVYVYLYNSSKELGGGVGEDDALVRGTMSRIGETQYYKYDFQASEAYTKVCFNNELHDGSWSNFWQDECSWGGTGLDFDNDIVLWMPELTPTTDINSCTYYNSGTWSVYPPAAVPSVSFNAVPSNVYLGQEVTFAAISENVNTPTYTYYVNDVEVANPYTFNAAGSYTVKVEVRENGAGAALDDAEMNITCTKYSLMKNNHSTKGDEVAVFTSTNGSTFTATWTCPSAATYYFYATKNADAGANTDCDYLNGNQTLTDGVASTAWLYGESNYAHSYTLNAPRAGVYTFTLVLGSENTFKCDFPEALAAEVSMDALPAFAIENTSLTFADYVASINVVQPEYTFFVKKGDAAYGAAVTSYTFAEAGTYTVKAEVREQGAGGEALDDIEKNITIYEPLTLYFINNTEWSGTDLHAYAYGDNSAQSATWPGVAMHDESTTTAGHSYAVYSITLEKDRYSHLIVNDGNSGDGHQTANLEINNATPYYYNGTWYATLAECDPAAASKQTYHLYVRKFVGWSEFDIYAWGDEEYLGAWPGKTAEDNTVVIDGATYSVYDFEAVPGDITMHLIFNNNGPGEGQEGDYRQLLDITEAKNCTIVVNDLAAWEGLAGEKRFRPYIPMEHIYGYQYDEYGTVGGAEWPGTELTPDAEGWYSFIVNKGRTVIFNNGVGADAMQTGDLAYTDEDPVADECAVWQGETNVAGEPAKTYMVTSSDCDAAIAIAYERNVTSGNYGTICLPYSAIRVEGATLYSIVGKSGDGHGYGEGIYIEQEDNLVMGKPYIFLANADKLVVRYWEGQSFTPSGDHLYTNNGLVGFINDGQNHLVAQDAHNFILYNNGLYYVDSEAYIASYRAFIDWSNIITNVPPVSSAPRRYIGVNKVATGVENINNAAQSTKVLHNGMLLIERNGNIYNAVGQKIQ